MLPHVVELTLDNIIYGEIKLAKKLQILKADLLYRHDYSNFSAFRTIDRYNEGYLTIESLKAFYRS